MECLCAKAQVHTTHTYIIQFSVRVHGVVFATHAVPPVQEGGLVSRQHPFPFANLHSTCQEMRSKSIVGRYIKIYRGSIVDCR